MKTLTALVVDDDTDTLDAFCESIQLHQFRIVISTTSGVKVAKLYQKFKPDVVFLDVALPDYDGIYALEQIRKVDPNANVIMIAADVIKETAEKLDKLKASTVIVYKPFHIVNMMDIAKALTSTKNQDKCNFMEESLSSKKMEMLIVPKIQIPNSEVHKI